MNLDEFIDKIRPSVKVVLDAERQYSMGIAAALLDEINSVDSSMASAGLKRLINHIRAECNRANDDPEFYTSVDDAISNNLTFEVHMNAIGTTVNAIVRCGDRTFIEDITDYESW